MKEFIESFNRLSKQIHQTAIEKGWWNTQTSVDYADKVLTDVYDSSYKTGGLKEAIMNAYEAGQNNKDRNNGELIALCHSELSEGLEGLRKDLDSDHIEGFKMIEEELADTIIRIMDMANARGYRVAEALIEKIEFNNGRSYKHGNKKF